MLRYFLFIVFFAYGYADVELLPVNEQGRFRPLGVISDPIDFAELKMLPSKRHPEIWLTLNQFQNATNPSLFSDQDWAELKKLYQNGDKEAFAKRFLEVYAPLTEKSYALSKTSWLNFPTVGQLRTEVWFSKWPLTNYAIIGYLGAILFFFLAEGFQKKPIKFLAWTFFLSAFAIHALILALRSYILMRPPVSGMAETVIYVPWIAACLSIFLSRSLKTSLPVIMGAAIAACLLTILQWTFTAYQLDNVQAVLNSQFWLTVHVLMIVASYGALILGGVLGHVFLLWEQPRLEKALIQSLYVGVALLIPGTILGGVWAAQSWGRFWDWDPKESWAFISSCVYLLVIHAYRFKKIGARGLAIGSIFGLMAISFTWYGVNYILGTGLHSYGFGTGGEWIYFSYLTCEVLFIIGCQARHKFLKIDN